MANIQKCRAIVLLTRRFKESSLIVSALSDRYGRINALARGARRPRSKFCGALEPFTWAEMIFYRKENRELHTLADAAVLDQFNAIRASPVKVQCADVLCEFWERTMPLESQDARAYRLMVSFLRKLAAAPEDESRAVVLTHLLRALAATGFRPHLADCVVCHRPVAGTRRSVFSIRRGGVVCNDHGDETGLSLSPASREFLVTALRSTGEAPSCGGGDELLAFVEAYCAYHLNGLRLNALGFI